MKINDPEDIISAYTAMQLLEPFCGKGYSLKLSIQWDRLSLAVVENEDFDVVATTARHDEEFVFHRVDKSYPQRLIKKLNAAAMRLAANA